MSTLLKSIACLFFIQIFFPSFSTAQFAEGKIIMQDKNRMIDVHTADLNGDGNLDVVGSGTTGILYYFGDEVGNFGVEQILTATMHFVYSISLADIDNDSDIDIVGSSFGDELFYFLNDGNGNFTAPFIIDSGFGTILQITTADIDEDNDMDILLVDRDEEQVVWYENMGAALFSTQQVIVGSVTPEHILVEDIQGDGHLDIVLAERVNGRISWLAGDGQGSFGTMQIIADDIYQVNTLTLADMDGNGTRDLLAGVSLYNDIFWYEHDGNGNFGTAQLISENSESPFHLEVVDVNEDSFPDILFSSYYGNKIGLLMADTFGVYPFESTASSNTNWAHKVITGDYNQDGNLDIMVAASQKIILKHGTGMGGFGAEQYVSNKIPNTLSQITSSDVNQDGFPEIFCSYYYQGGSTANAGLSILQLTNTPSENRFVPQIIDASPVGSDHIFLEDLNGDGITDYIKEPHIGDFLEFYAGNMDGTFDLQNQFFVDTPFYDYSLVDLDQDEDLDLIFSSYYNVAGQFNPEIFWASNDGLGNFSSPNVLVPNLPEFYTSTTAADLDNDGDLDLVARSYSGDRIDWFENEGNLVYGPAQVVVTNFNAPSRIVVKDLNNDGAQDILYCSSNEDKMAWVQNLGNGTFSSPYEFPQYLASIRDIAAEDLDNDGDLEIIASITGSSNDALYIYDNLGAGNFSNPQNISNQNSPRELHLTDVDNDGDLDIICGGSSLLNFGNLRVFLYENLSPSGIMNYNVSGNFNLQCSNNELAFISVNGFGGQAPYTIEWSDNSLSGFTINNLSAGSYTFTISDAANTSYTETIEITEVPPINITVDVLPEIGGMANGSINVIPNGGTPPYQYNWNTNSIQNDSIANNLSAGTYEVTITDINGCIEITEVTVSQINEIVNIPNVTITDLLCYGDASGAIEVSVAGGLPPYSIDWSSQNIVGFMPTNLSAGIYEFTVTDSLGFSVLELVNITQPPLIELTTESTPTQDGASNGTASVTSVGGIAPVTYSWNTVPPQNTNLAIGLGVGTYIVTATDADNCTSIDSVSVEVTTAITQLTDNPALQFFPNPVGKGHVFSINNLTVDAAPNTIRFISSTGMVLKNGVGIEAMGKNLEYRIFNSGVYFVEITDGAGERFVGKIIVVE